MEIEVVAARLNVAATAQFEAGIVNRYGVEVHVPPQPDTPPMVEPPVATIAQDTDVP